MRVNTPLHYKLADMLIELMQKGTHRRVTQERVTDGNFEQIQLAESSFMLSQEIAIIDLTIYDDLKLNAIKLLIQIQKELKVNNPLWECPNKDLSEVRSGLAQLKLKDIIRPITGTDIYIINPEKIRRGKPLTVLAALYQYCKTNYERDRRWKLTNTDIKRLLGPTSISL